MITSAPGKVVLWGEYAVLAGAPAAIMALDLRASVDLALKDTFSSFSANGYQATGLQTARTDFPHLPVTSMIETILHHLGYTQLPSHLYCHTDTTPFFHHGKKMGLGSSAALCVALYSALCGQLSHTPRVAEALLIHQSWQGSGSGLDIAASWHGGVIRFSAGVSAQIAWPDDLYHQIIFTGAASSTAVQLSNFSEWLEREAKNPHLDALCRESENLFTANLDDGALSSYVTALRALDRAGSLNIFTQAHETLATIGADLGIVYKPCGAGGGDVGIALSRNSETLETFANRASQAGFIPLKTEIAKHGIQARDNREQ